MPAAPTRRFRSLAALVGVLLLSSCAVVDRPAASVGGSDLDDGTFRDVLAARAQGDPTVSANVARQLLTDWIESRVLVDALAQLGGAVTEADLAEAEARRAEGDPGWAALPEDAQAFFREVDAAQLAFTRAAGPTSEELRAIYDQGGEASSIICIRAVLVATEAEAEQVRARSDAGEDFAALAKELSVDPTGASGGIIESSPGNPCIDTTQFQPTAVIDVAAATAIGEASDPVQIDAGWVVVLPRPFDEVAEAAGNILSARATVQLQQELVTSAEASVQSRYGTWVPELGAVLPVGRVPAPASR
jgi:parvulin-like peptidyl-prolyl isomerase